MKNIVVDFSDDTIRTALVENGVLVELMIDGYENKLTLGNIFLGVVQSILPSRFAFIDIGQERNVFLNLNDKKESRLYKNGKLNVKQGQKVLIQLLKNSSNDKSEVVTSQLAFSDQNAVLFINPTGEVGVSKKIRSKNERSRLRKIAESALPDGYGIIMRTNSKDKPEDELRETVTALQKRAESVIKRGKHARAPSLVYEEDFIIGNTLKELYSPDVDGIIINSKKYLADVVNIVEEMNGDGKIVALHDKPEPIFQPLEKQINRILTKKVWLKSGGFIVIEQTEACVVIDVNTGKYTGGKDLSKSVLKTNLEAAVSIAFEIRLRNLSGMIIIDFINMRDSADKAVLRKVLGEELKKDRIAVDIAGMTRLGLMQLTRKKTRRPVAERLSCECTACGGVGRVKI